MSNMSYCRFENTLADLRDCYDNMENDVNSKSESQARKALIRLCQEIVDYYSEEDFKEEVED